MKGRHPKAKPPPNAYLKHEKLICGKLFFMHNSTIQELQAQKRVLRLLWCDYAASKDLQIVVRDGICVYEAPDPQHAVQLLVQITKLNKELAKLEQEIADESAN